jgi:hypothetical protein
LNTYRGHFLPGKRTKIGKFLTTVPAHLILFTQLLNDPLAAAAVNYSAKREIFAVVNYPTLAGLQKFRVSLKDEGWKAAIADWVTHQLSLLMTSASHQARHSDGAVVASDVGHSGYF